MMQHPEFYTARLQDPASYHDAGQFYWSFALSFRLLAACLLTIVEALKCQNWKSRTSDTQPIGSCAS